MKILWSSVILSVCALAGALIIARADRYQALPAPDRPGAPFYVLDKWTGDIK